MYLTESKGLKKKKKGKQKKGGKKEQNPPSPLDVTSVLLSTCLFDSSCFVG